MIKQSKTAIILIGVALGVGVGRATAADLDIKAVMVPKDQIRLDFVDGTRHFVVAVRREGRSEGSGPLAGAAVTEHGWHDIVPGVGGDPRGYLVFSASKDDIAYVKWQVRAVFVPGPEGKPKLLDNGFWELVGGTGKFKGLKGAGTLHIKAVSPTDREFSLTGEVAGGA